MTEENSTTMLRVTPMELSTSAPIIMLKGMAVLMKILLRKPRKNEMRPITNNNPRMIWSCSSLTMRRIWTL